MLRNVIPRLLGQVPVSWRRAAIGRPDNPSRLATFVHNLLNRIPPGNSQVFDCQGPLAGYRMSIDWNLFRSFVYGTWEPEVTAAIVAAAKPGMTVIDIGAHIGYYTLLFAKCVGAAGQVFAFEPMPENFALLQKNIALNHLPYVRTLNEAVFSRAGDITVAIPPGEHLNSGSGSVYVNGGSRNVLVRATSVDLFSQQSGIRPDILKMDVEGAEFDVLMGARDTIDRFRPTMLIELHHFDGNLAAHPVPDLLAGWNYQIHWLERSQLTSHILATTVA